MHHLHDRPATSANSQPSAAELREFVKGLKAKKPDEILGEAAKGHLVRAVIQATIGTLVLLVILTVVPYLMSRGAANPEPEAKAEKSPPVETKADVKHVETSKLPTPKEDPATAEKKGSPTLTPAIAEKLQENKAKAGTPKDPFGTNLNDLLDK